MKIDKSKVELHALQLEDVDTYIDFIDRVKSTMEHPEWLGDFTKEDICYMLEHGSYGYFFFYEGIIVGSSLMIPAREKDIQKFELDFDYQKTIDYGPEGVLKDAQGNGLQLFILEHMDRISRKKGYLYGVTTVHPDNIYCIRNMEKHGFVYERTKEFKRGTRNIYQKSIK